MFMLQSLFDPKNPTTLVVGVRQALLYTATDAGTHSGVRFLNRAGVYEYLDALDLRDASDNGSYDERIAAAGCTKIALHEIPSILRPLGVKVLTAASPGPDDER